MATRRANLFIFRFLIITIFSVCLSQIINKPYERNMMVQYLPGVSNSNGSVGQIRNCKLSKGHNKQTRPIYNMPN